MQLLANPRVLMVRFLVLLVFLFGLFEFVGSLGDLQAAVRVRQAAEDLRRLAVVSAALLKERGRVDGEATLRVVPAEVSRKDPWGHAYYFTGEGGRLVWWSSGRDGRRRTSDDLRLSLASVAKELGLDENGEANEVTGQGQTGAPAE